MTRKYIRVQLCSNAREVKRNTAKERAAAIALIHCAQRQQRQHVVVGRREGGEQLFR